MTRVAPAAAAILTQATALRPNRSKASDGTIGDKAHRNRVSDHNPDRRGVVHAADLTHDPAHGMDAHGWAKWLADRRDPRVKYIISNRRIWEPGYGWAGYGGSNPHDKHVHVSVITRLENDTSPWFDGFLAPTPFTTTPKPAPAPVVTPPPYVPAAPVATLPTVQEDDMPGYLFTDGSKIWLTNGLTKREVPFNGDRLNELSFLGQAKNTRKADGGLDIPLNAAYLDGIPVA